MTDKTGSTMGRKLKLKELRVHMGLFDFSVNFVMGDYSKVEKYVSWKFEDKDFDPKVWDMGYKPRGKIFYRQGYCPIIWIPKKPKTSREYATLAHECIHAVFRLMEWTGMNINYETEEVVTHATAHLMNEILKGIK